MFTKKLTLLGWFSRFFILSFSCLTYAKDITFKPVNISESLELNPSSELIRFESEPELVQEKLPRIGLYSFPNTQHYPQKLPVKEILKIEHGFTIAYIYMNKKKFAGKRIRIRGKVTSFNAAIMNKNWLHLIDASSPRELIVTSKNRARVGDIVTAVGNITLDKDFGYGYQYDVLMENAKIYIE